MGSIFKRTGDQFARLMEVVTPLAPPTWTGINVVVVPGPNEDSAHILLTNPTYDEDMSANQAVADVVMPIIRSSHPPTWRTGLIQLTKKNEKEWQVEVHFE